MYSYTERNFCEDMILISIAWIAANDWIFLSEEVLIMRYDIDYWVDCLNSNIYKYAQLHANGAEYGDEAKRVLGLIDVDLDSIRGLDASYWNKIRPQVSRELEGIRQRYLYG